MKFIDKSEIHVRAGNGGPGAVSFMSARNRPKLGPDGGNGGPGGDVILVATGRHNTLSCVRYRQMYKAGHGGRGGSQNCTGAAGQKCKILVPLGTVIRNRETGELLGELLEEGEKLVVAKGGKRGYGNLHYVLPTRQAPTQATPGEKGEHLTLALELKLLADVGLAGFPNAGKSSLLSHLSSARPRIADYPFTTLVPNLGVVDVDAHSGASFVVADVPGLIEGAAQGRGLGHEFLRHLERTRVLIYLIDPFNFEEQHPFDAFQILEKELGDFKSELVSRPSLVALNKSDLCEDDDDWGPLEAPFRERGIEVLRVSAVTGDGLKQLKTLVYKLLVEEKRAEETIPGGGDNG